MTRRSSFNARSDSSDVEAWINGECVSSHRSEGADPQRGRQLSRYQPDRSVVNKNLNASCFASSTWYFYLCHHQVTVRLLKHVLWWEITRKLFLFLRFVVCKNSPILVVTQCVYTHVLIQFLQAAGLLWGHSAEICECKQPFSVWIFFFIYSVGWRWFQPLNAGKYHFNNVLIFRFSTSWRRSFCVWVRNTLQWILFLRLAEEGRLAR